MLVHRDTMSVANCQCLLVQWTSGTVVLVVAFNAFHSNSIELNSTTVSLMQKCRILPIQYCTVPPAQPIGAAMVHSGFTFMLYCNSSRQFTIVKIQAYATMVLSSLCGTIPMVYQADCCHARARKTIISSLMLATSQITTSPKCSSDAS
jgi:hypothetical protein